jgi:hypothetical protein
MKKPCKHNKVYESVGHDLLVKCVKCSEVSLANNWASGKWKTIGKVRKGTHV